MIPIAFLTPSEQRNRAGTIPIVQTGPVRTVPFDGGEAWFVEEGTTNLVVRTQNELPSTTFTNSTAHFTRTIISNEICRIERLVENAGWVYSGNTAETYIVSAGDIWTQSLEVRGDNINWANPSLIVLQLWGKTSPEAERSEHSTNRQVIGIEELEDGWRRVTARSEWKFDCVSAGGSIFCYSLAIEAGHIVEVRRPQIEARPYATTYARGDMGTGYSWAATPHQSASIRQDARLGLSSTVPIPYDFGTVYMRTDGSRMFAGIGRSNIANALVLMRVNTPSSNRTRVRVVDDEGVYNDGDYVPNMPNGERNRIVGWWDQSTASGLFNDGLSVTSRGLLSESGVWNTHNGISMFIGVNWYGDYFLNAAIGCVVVFDRVLTSDEIAYLDSIPTADFTWDTVARPEVMVKRNGEIVRAVGYRTKHASALQDIQINR